MPRVGAVDLFDLTNSHQSKPEPELHAPPPAPLPQISDPPSAVPTYLFFILWIVAFYHMYMILRFVIHDVFLKRCLKTQWAIRHKGNHVKLFLQFVTNDLRELTLYLGSTSLLTFKIYEHLLKTRLRVRMTNYWGIIYCLHLNYSPMKELGDTLPHKLYFFRFWHPIVAHLMEPDTVRSLYVNFSSEIQKIRLNPVSLLDTRLPDIPEEQLNLYEENINQTVACLEI